jgi:hypothetical protein
VLELWGKILVALRMISLVFKNKLCQIPKKSKHSSLFPLDLIIAMCPPASSDWKRGVCGTRIGILYQHGHPIESRPTQCLGELLLIKNTYVHI